MKTSTLLAFIGGVIALLLVLAAAAFLVPSLYEAFSMGLGLRTSAIISFVVTIACLVVFALVSGDGLIGELPVMISGFFVFFLFFWFMIAWIF